MIRVALPVGTLLWRVDGIVATVAGLGEPGALVRVDGESDPVPLGEPGRWRLAMPCEHCDQAARVQLRDGQPTDLLCKACAGNHFDQPGAWVRPIPATVVRQLWPQCWPVI